MHVYAATTERPKGCVGVWKRPLGVLGLWGEGECSGTGLIISQPKERPHERAGLSFCSREREITFQKSTHLF